MRTVKSFVFREVQVEIPRISFSMGGYKTWNAWEFLGWFFCLMGVLFAGVLILGVGKAFYRHMTIPQPPDQPKTAQQEYVDSCRYADSDMVVNVGNKDPALWTCVNTGGD